MDDQGITWLERVPKIKLLPVKNAQDRLVVLNRVARSVIEAQRGIHLGYVLVYAPTPRRAKPGQAAVGDTESPGPLARMNGTAWRTTVRRSQA